MLDPVDPLAIVSVPGHPRVQALSTDGSLVVFSQVLVPITEALVTFSVALVVEPVTFIHSTDFVDADAMTMTVSIDKLAPIQGLLVTLDGKVFFLLQLLEVEKICDHLINHELLLFLLRQMFMRVTSFPLFVGNDLGFGSGLGSCLLHVM